MTQTEIVFLFIATLLLGVVMGLAIANRIVDNHLPKQDKGEGDGV